MLPATTLPANQLIDHIGFRDWIAQYAGLYAMPGETGMVAVALDRGGPLRITQPLMQQPVACTILDVIDTGQYLTGIGVERTTPAVRLATLRRRRGARRLLLETQLQRKRLLPRWLNWLKGAAEAKESVFGMDLWAMRHLRRATFDELAFMAQWPPSLGSRMMWALVHTDAGRAVALFLHWALSGEQRRFAGIGEQLTLVVEASASTPHAAEYARLLTLLVDVTSNSAAG